MNHSVVCWLQITIWILDTHVFMAFEVIKRYKNVQSGPKKWEPLYLALTLLNINRFSKFFYSGNSVKIPTNFIQYISPHLKYVAACEVWHQNFFIVMLVTLNIVSYVWQEMTLFMSYGWVNVNTVIIVAQTFWHVPVHMLKDANATHQCTVNDAIDNVMPYTQ